eukprot:755294-Hanusia_phi.AAC.1
MELRASLIIIAAPSASGPWCGSTARPAPSTPCIGRGRSSDGQRLPGVVRHNQDGWWLDEQGDYSRRQGKKTGETGKRFRVARDQRRQHPRRGA